MWKYAVILIALLIHPATAQLSYGIDTYYVNMAGDEVDFEAFSGKPLVVEAFATWCSHCQAEHEELVKLWDEYNGSVNMISLSVADDDTLSTIEDYLVDYPSSWSIGWDRDATFADMYNIEAFPAILIFDSDGQFGSCDVGERSFEAMSKDLDAILANPNSYVQDNGSSGKCESPAWYEQIPPLIWFGLLLSLSFTIYYIVASIRKRNKTYSEK